MRHGDLEDTADSTAADRISELSVPVLLIVGSTDTPYIHDIARAISTLAPNARRIDLSGVGHMVNIEAPDAFLAAVVPFLTR
jgi:pimeloyl-ACP methyl ester carboxylesterase